MELSGLDRDLLKEIADIEAVPTGAYNVRRNGKLAGRNTTANIDIVTKTDRPGIDIIIKSETKGERVDIPVILTETGLDDLVYNDFYVEDGADVVIVAGCGIHNAGGLKSEHDGIHAFHIGKNAKVLYIEKHYG
ncbi:MAG: SufD family Fe-S cluster assembly protein, partial [Firmicutes bacterium]|nr:SufD family Fe-S cluster assembly protein [Bacillota bacterium]